MSKFNYKPLRSIFVGRGGDRILKPFFSLIGCPVTAAFPRADFIISGQGSYGPVSPSTGGGYSDRPLGPSMYRVVYRRSGPDSALGKANKRAAELCGQDCVLRMSIGNVAISNVSGLGATAQADARCSKGQVRSVTSSRPRRSGTSFSGPCRPVPSSARPRG